LCITAILTTRLPQRVNRVVIGQERPSIHFRSAPKADAKSEHWHLSRSAKLRHRPRFIQSPRRRRQAALVAQSVRAPSRFIEARRFDSAGYCLGETRVATLALLIFTAFSGWRSCGVVITKFSGHAVSFRSSPTVFADTPMCASASTRILSGKPPTAMWRAGTLLGLYRIRGPSLFVQARVIRDRAGSRRTCECFRNILEPDVTSMPRPPTLCSKRIPPSFPCEAAAHCRHISQFVLFAMSSSTGLHFRCSACTKAMASAGDIARV
jgi:hypothetical protein